MSVNDPAPAVTQVDSAYVQAHADERGVVSLDLRDDSAAIYRVDVEVLDDVLLASEEATIPALDWLAASDYGYGDAESIVFGSPSAADTYADEGFRASIIACVWVGVLVCVLVDIP